MLRLVLKHSRAGTQVTYVPGNHDEVLRRLLPLELEVAGVKLRREETHVLADGRRLLVIHGDEFDSVVRYARFLALLARTTGSSRALIKPHRNYAALLVE